MHDEFRELEEAIEKIRPDLEATAREAETQRSAPPALVDALRRARVPMSKVPRELGGYELPPAQQVRFFARLSYLNPTAGWIAFNQSGAAGMAGAMLSDAGIERVFERDSPLFAAVSAPTGKSVKTDGGYRVSGRWAYASGAACAEWLLLVTLCSDPPGPLVVILPREQAVLHDNWHVAALQGTGSVDVEVDDVFVPEELTVSPLGERKRGGPQYTGLGYKLYVAGENLGFTLGVAQRLVDEVATLARDKKRLMDPTTVGERGAFQYELGRADQQVRAARAHMEAELERVMQRVEDSGTLAQSDRERAEAATVWATEALSQAAARLFPFAGASALALSSPIQRAYRDIIGSAQHYVTTNEHFDVWGRALVAGNESC